MMFVLRAWEPCLLFSHTNDDGARRSLKLLPISWKGTRKRKSLTSFISNNKKATPKSTFRASNAAFLKVLSLEILTEPLLCAFENRRTAVFLHICILLKYFIRNWKAVRRGRMCFPRTKNASGKNVLSCEQQKVQEIQHLLHRLHFLISQHIVSIAYSSLVLFMKQNFSAK